VVLPAGNYNMNSLTKYRAKGRFPVLSWVGPKNQCLVRSSQALPGTFGQVKCEDDISILESFMKMSGYNYLFVYDARPKLNTKATRIQGGGMESSSAYPFCSFVNLAMDSIKDVKNSFMKLLKTVVFDTRESYEFKLSIENSKWLQSIDALIGYAKDIATKLYSGCSILIHCRNGWDTTCQLVSLVLIMVDPYYRTIEGFLVLIQREWVAMGHRFTLRTGCGVKWDIDILPLISSYYPAPIKKYNSSIIRANIDNSSDTATSPIFFQFIEAVHHIKKAHPNEFQFKDNLLVFIADSLYSGRFSTFYEGTIKDFNYSNTPSMFDYIMENVLTFNNQEFIGNSVTLFPVIDMSQSTLWDEYFFREEKNAIRIHQTS
ncbi:myotubularin, putative, partial [Entamoeba invadens IP1]